MLFGMDEISTWQDVAERLKDMGRGATARLAKALDNMDPSYLRRKLETTQELTLSQQRKVQAFLEGAPDVTDAPPRSRLVPVYGYAAASGGDRIAFNTGEILDWMELPMGMLPPGDVFVVRALGSSMEPRIFDGEPLVVRRGTPPAREKDAVIEFLDGSAVVKTYKAQRSGRVFAHQYNPDQEVNYDATQVRAMHAVWCRL